MVIAEFVLVISQSKHIAGLGNLSMVRFLMDWSLTTYAETVDASTQIISDKQLSAKMYWLESAHLSGPLTLEVRGERAEVKSASALDLAKIENKKPRTWQGMIR